MISARMAWSGVAAATALLAWAAPAHAALECGDDISQDKTLKGDLDCSSAGTGLEIVADGVTLDLDGHEIRGGILGLGVHVDGRSGVTIKNGEIRDFQVGIEVQSSTAVRVKNLEVRSALDHAVEVSGSDDVEVEDSLLKNTEDLAAVRVSTSRGILFADNEIDGGGGNGFGSFGSQLLTVTGNKISDVTDDGIYGEALVGSAIEDNNITDVGGVGIFLATLPAANVLASNAVKRTGLTGILVDAGDGPNRLVGNEVSRAGTNGIHILSGANDVLLRKNVAERSTDDGIHVDDTDTLIQRNTADRNGELGIESASSFGSDNRARDNGDPDECDPASLCA